MAERTSSLPSVLRAYREGAGEIRPFANPGEMDRRLHDEAADERGGLHLGAMLVIAYVGLVIGFVAGFAVGGGLS